LRANASQAEQKLWHHLRRKQVNGLRFRRQFPVGPYFADFVCLRARLIVEVDGGQHGLPAQQAHDGRRTAWLEANGFRVIRFWADEVMTNITAVMDGIEAAMKGLLPQGIARARSHASHGAHLVVRPSFGPRKRRGKNEVEAPK
jgi:very-short-patch-repair endonuclease